jgi:serine-aspartate repeat-containing protein C/D/E
MEWLEDRSVPSATASISGHVFVDQTGNGLSADDVTQRGAIVLLYADTNHNGVLDSRDRLVDFQFTGANGAYSFAKLAAGSYFVTDVVPNGFVRTGPAVAADYAVQLAGGQNVTGDDFDNFRLPDTSAVRNVTFAITHGTTTTTVTSLRGNTHAGDTVVANFTIARGAAPTVVSLVSYDTPGSSFSASTAGQDVQVGDATGTFGPGTRSLTITIPTSNYEVDFVAGAAINHFGPAGSNVFYSAEQRLISSDNGAGVAVQANASLSGVVYLDNNGNSLLDTGDSGQAGVLVSLTGTNYLGQAVTMTATTDSNGAYSFTGLLPGTYRIDVNPPGGFNAEAANAGSLGGTTGVATVLNIVVANGAAGTGYNFAEIPGIANS